MGLSKGHMRASKLMGSVKVYQVPHLLLVLMAVPASHLRALLRRRGTTVHKHAISLPSISIWDGVLAKRGSEADTQNSYLLASD